MKLVGTHLVWASRHIINQIYCEHELLPLLFYDTLKIFPEMFWSLVRRPKKLFLALKHIKKHLRCRRVFFANRKSDPGVNL